MIHKFQTVACDVRCTFVGNVKIGEDLTVDDLRSHYHAVTLAYGADHDKLLDVEGETLRNVLSARAFVGWYNGLPTQRNLQPNLSCTDVVIIGHGNVALDVARVLLTPIDELRKTDITNYALEQLSQSRVRRVYLIGRRGLFHVAFTAAELREMLRIPNCQFRVDRMEIQSHLGNAIRLADQNRQKKRLMAILNEIVEKSEAATVDHTNDPRRECYFKFLRSPHRILPDPSGESVNAIELEINRLSEEGEHARPMSTGVYETIPCGLVLRSIGYRSLPVQGVPFDSRLGIIPNHQGRVLASDGIPILGLYTSGWLKRGPMGVIATTMYDAFETADSILHDLASHPSHFTEERLGILGIRQIFDTHHKFYVPYRDWLKIDTIERLRGQQEGKPREKIVVISEMLDIARGVPSSSTS